MQVVDKTIIFSVVILGREMVFREVQVRPQQPITLAGGRDHLTVALWENEKSG